MDPTVLALFLLVGLLAGWVSGLMGVGGGIVMTPVLHYILHYAWTEAIALSLAVIAVQSPVGIWRHHRRGSVRARVAVPLVVGGAVGVGAGVWLEPRIGVPALRAFFAVVMLFAAYRLVGKVPHAAAQLPVAVVALVGAGAGLVSRLLGVGGGIITVPALAMGGLGAHVAVASSLVPVFSNAAVATAFNAGRDLDWILCIPLALGAVAGSPLGVRCAHALPELGLRRVVAAALALGAVYVLATSGVL